MNIVTCNFKWASPLIPLDLKKVLFLVVHHIDAKEAYPDQIHEWHLSNGWAGFGYNEYIRKDGTVYIGRGDNIGAQCANLNSKSYGIAVEGNYDVETKMPPAQMQSLVERLSYHKKRLPNCTEIGPHGKYTSTSCPGKYFPLEQVLSLVNTPVTTHSANCDLLKQKRLINTKEYWELNAVVNGTIKGEYAAALIKNVAEYIRCGH